MDDNETTIPLVDFGGYSLENDKNLITKESLEELAYYLYEAFTNVGFAYLKNHGISQDRVSEVISVSSKFFSLPNEVKSKYRRSSNEHGWVQRQTSHPMRESYTFVPQIQNDLPSPDNDISGFSDAEIALHKECNELLQRILHVVGISLKLEDPYYLCKLHNTYEGQNRTTLKTLYYPPVDKGKVIPGQIRLAEHTDFGSITLLFQDNTGGLEAQSGTGEFVSVKPIPGTVIVNIGDIMKIWTCDKLKSTNHRVVNPDDQSTSRCSVVFFGNPDSNCQITCLNGHGCKKHPPMVYEEYLNKKISS